MGSKSPIIRSVVHIVTTLQHLSSVKCVWRTFMHRRSMFQGCALKDLIAIYFDSMLLVAQIFSNCVHDSWYRTVAEPWSK
jgi:hypothetical protein